MRQRESTDVAHRLTVHQPEKMKDLLTLLEILEGVTEQVKGPQPAGAGAQIGDDDQSVSVPTARQAALANLPAASVMQQRLVRSLEREVQDLQRQARRAARSFRRGSAYLLNELYARIRKIQAMIAEILSAAQETIERLYVRLFVDGQPIV